VEGSVVEESVFVLEGSGEWCRICIVKVGCRCKREAYSQKIEHTEPLHAPFDKQHVLLSII
jgi:hypothetical protein